MSPNVPAPLQTGIAIITDVSRAPRARIEAPGDPRQQAWGARRRAADAAGRSGWAFAYHHRRQATEGSVIPRGGSRGG